MEKKPVTHFLVGGIMGAITILSSVILIITDQIQNQSLNDNRTSKQDSFTADIKSTINAVAKYT